MGPLYEHLRATDLADLIAAAQADEHDDSPAMNEIIRRFDAKAKQIARAVCLRPADREDAANIARLALTRAVRRHRADRSGFTTYVTIFMTGAARRESVRLAYRETCLDGPDLAAAAASAPESLRLGASGGPPGSGMGRTAEIIASLPKRQQQLLDARYVQDLDLAVIAREHGTSVSAVSQRLTTAHKHLVRLMPPIAGRNMAA